MKNLGDESISAGNRNNVLIFAGIAIEYTSKLLTLQKPQTTQALEKGALICQQYLLKDENKRSML